MTTVSLTDIGKIAAYLLERKQIYYIATKAIPKVNEDGEAAVYAVKKSQYSDHDIYVIHPDHLEKFLTSARSYGFEPIDQKEAWKREREAKTQEIAGRMSAEGE